MQRVYTGTKNLSESYSGFVGTCVTDIRCPPRSDFVLYHVSLKRAQEQATSAFSKSFHKHLSLRTITVSSFEAVVPNTLFHPTLHSVIQEFRF